jgi:hypothetical protein
MDAKSPAEFVSTAGVVGLKRTVTTEADSVEVIEARSL